MKKLNKPHFDKCIKICKTQCPHYGADRLGRVGCLVLWKCTGKCPTRIEDHLLDGGGCLADPPLFEKSSEKNIGNTPLFRKQSKKRERLVDPPLSIELSKKNIKDHSTNPPLFIKISEEKRKNTNSSTQILPKELIVARYNEDIDWLDDVKIPYIIYNKGKSVNNPNSITLPNIGREAHTWLYHFITRRDSLADVTFLAQGNPFEHSADFLARLNHDYIRPISLTTQYQDSYPPQEIKDCDLILFNHGHIVRLGNIDHQKISQTTTVKEFTESLKKAWPKILKTPKPTPYYFGYGAMWAVPKQTILARSNMFWENLLGKLMTDPDITAWTIEALWAAIFEAEKYESYL